MSRFSALAERKSRRRKVSATISLVSLMDVFTILVFFLLVNSTEGEVLPGSKIKLPNSVSQQKPRQTVVIVVDGDDIVVQGRKIVSVAQALSSNGDVIEPLKAELTYLANKSSAAGRSTERTAVTIMGDRTIRYNLLKKIMVTCSYANYPDISLAVNQKSKGEG